MSDNIKVVVKVRPLIHREIEDKLAYQWRVKNNTLYQIDQNSRDVIKAPSYTFDKIYDKDTNTSDVYNDVAKPIVQAAIKGFNGTIFAYGQTSSGKTFTMTGTDEHPGIIPLAVHDLFETIKNIPGRDFLVSVSYIEIYNETLQDLLSSDQDKKIKIQETLHGVKVDVQGKMTSSPDEVLELMKTGQNNRQIGSTNMNEKSSRSHTILQITIESREHVEEEEKEVGCVNVSVLNLVDLAGSERAGQTGATGQRFVEGTYINKSLSTLAGVIRQLAEDPKKFVNFRDSKLTRILQNSLGGNAKTSIICAVTPAAVEETVSTLQFANRAKAIKNTPQVIVRSTNDSMIQTLTRQLGKLQSELVNKKNIEEDNVKLQRKIAELQQLIINGFSHHQTNSRRKPPPLRRATISTLPSTEEEHRDTKPRLQKYCTPVLKYNPLLISAPEFPPASSKPSLKPVPEETRTTTPSPRKKVEFMEKVVEIIDSDDEEISDLKTCAGSPSHDCYNATKTPPCVLRKQAKQIEKDYRDLQQMTELEKMYPPDVVELIKKLDDYKTEMCKMEEEINRLNKQSKQKDFEKSMLESKVNETQEEIKNICMQKINLETQCKEFQTKLTDIEVMYDILKNKSKKREEELLCLLDENKNQKTHKIGVPQVTLCEKEFSHFMNISKDISLVNSDNENSIMSPNKESTKLKQDLFHEVHAVQENAFIKELEAEIIEQKQKIDTLEQNSLEQIKLIDNLREQLSESEKDNFNLKNSIESLNIMIINRDETIEQNRKDMVSCNVVIKDLQIKLASKEYLPNMNLGDDVIEGLIANEDKLMANNENMLNIIHSLKKTIDNRNKEIINFKTEVEQQSEKLKNVSDIKQHIETRDTQISLLTSQLEKLKSQETQNITTIDELLNEKRSWTSVETELKQKINNIQNQITSAEELSNANEDTIKSLQDQNQNLCQIIQEKDKLEIELKEKVVLLLAQLKDSTSIVGELRSKLEEKDSKINSYQSQFDPILLKAQSVINVINNIMLVLTGNTVESPDLGNFDDALDHLHDLLITTETSVKDLMLRNTDLSNENSELKFQIDTLTKEQQNVLLKIDKLNFINDNLSQKNKGILQDNLNLTHKHLELTKQYEEADRKIIEITAKYSQSQDDLVKSAQALEFMNIENQNITKEKEEEIAIKLNKLTREQQEILENISAKIMDSSKDLNLELQTCNNVQNSYTKIMHLLQVLYDNIAADTDRKTHSDSTTNINLTTDMHTQLDQIQQENKILNEDLTQRSQHLKQLHSELKIRSSEIKQLESTVHTWQTEFKNLQEIMQKQLHDLQQDNFKLKERGFGVDNEDNSSSQITSDYGESIIGSNPPSLTTLSFNKIQHLINSNSNEISSEVNITRNDENMSSVGCQCPDLAQELEKVKSENTTLMDVIRDLKSVNLKLLDEQEAMCNEVDSLVGPSKELQKKIANHKTTLSTLTATTYAEHQLLKTKLTALQHHHSRFYNICLRDLPSLKEPLEKLMIILKGERPQDEKLYLLPNVLDDNCSNLKNESSIDPDNLMLDTNLTMNTINNTLIGHDQTCLIDITQAQLLDSDLSVVGQNMSILKPENETQEIQAQIDSEDVDQIRYQKLFCDAQCSPFKITDKNNQELTGIKEDFQKQLDVYIEKVNYLEKESCTKTSEINKLTIALNNKCCLLKELQEENDSLSTQIMDNLTEVDNLKAELDKWKQINADLELSLQNAKETIKQDSISRRRSSEHSPLNRSLSDSDSVSSYNKMCTLQNEICAVKEGCKQLTHEVTAIQNHLEQGDLSTMSLDNTIEVKDMMLTEETSKLDIYASEKLKCLKFYAEITDSEPDFNNDMTIVDIIKLLHDKIVLKHSNEVENLMNQLKDLQETKDNLQTQITKLDTEYDHQKSKINKIQELFTQIKCNINAINNEVTDKHTFKNNLELLKKFKNNVFGIIDTELEISSANIFDVIVNNIAQYHENDLLTVISNFTELQEKSKSLIDVNNEINKNLAEMKQKMDLREEEYNLLKRQKDKVHEISNAVTLDIIQKEYELNQVIFKGCEKLIQSNKNIPATLHPDLPASKNLDIIFDFFLNQQNITDNDNLILDLKESKSIIADKESELNNLKTQIEKLTTMNEKLNIEATDNIAKIETQNSIYEELKRIYHGKVEENDANIQLIANLTEETGLLKETISQNEVMLQELHSKLLMHSVCEICIQKDNLISELSNKVTTLNRELETLRQANEIVSNEKETLDNELEKALLIISQNKIDIDKMNTDILVLRESTKENVIEIENLKAEAKSLLALNAKLKSQFEEKQKDCSRLDINIKTHEKTAEIQSKIIMRLQTQKDQVDATLREKDEKINDLSQELKVMQETHEVAMTKLNSAKEEIEVLKRTKSGLERRVSELEVCVESKSARSPAEAGMDICQQRRQSLADSRRMFGEGTEQKLEDLFMSRAKPDDLFIDADNDSSNRSTPAKHTSRKSDVRNHSRLDQSDRESDGSRPSSVTAARKQRRQSSHDLHRILPNQRPPSSLFDESKQSDSSNRSSNTDVDTSQLKERIASYLQEIEELKERNRELDEECETCAAYLRERDEQCGRLKKEKAALENVISDLKEKLKTSTASHSHLESQPETVDASVNTDEDWANLHSVVVDRMSYDAEVEKNKRLMKITEQLRIKKQEMRNTIAKMQHALEKNAQNSHSEEKYELKSELEALKQELCEVKERNRELDEECETCATYLRERDEQCRKLREAKNALEAKLEELESSHKLATSLRKKRQSLHDQHRPNTQLDDASTHTDDILSYHVERDCSRDTEEVKHLKMTIQKLSHQLTTMGAAATQQVYVATGSAIVQNQQITDVMKENQKLKVMNAKLVKLCKKRGKSQSDSNRENEESTDQHSNVQS